MRSKEKSDPSGMRRDSSILPRSNRFRKMFSAGGQVATQTVAPAWARHFAMAKPKPPSSATPATRARFPVKSMFSMDVRYYLARVPTPAGIFILGELSGLPVTVIHDITRQFDPKLARLRQPHITLAGSSGVGPLPADLTAATLRKHLEPITSTTAPISLPLQPAHRFPQTNTIVLPIDPHGAIRVLHDRIASCGLSFGPARFTFSPHVTLNLYRTLTRDTLDALLRVRINAPVILEKILMYYTCEPQPAKLLLELPLMGA